MLSLLLLFAPLAAELAAIYLLSDYLNRRLYARLGKVPYLLVMWPGVIVHELSHYAACLLTLTKVYEVKLFAPHQEGDSLVLGYVRHAQPRGPLSAALIGAAPFFGGAAALWAGLRFLVPTFAAGGHLTPAALFSLPARLDWQEWTAYVFLYLVVVLSCHIAPSKPDMIGALQGVAGLLVFLGLAVILGRYFHLAISAAWIERLAGQIGRVSVLLSYGLAFTFILAGLTFLLEVAARLIKR